MSTPDARLSAAERAAFADLEAAARAADPSLADRLRGHRPGRRARVLLQPMAARTLRIWAVVLGRRAWGGPITVAGFLLMALGLTAGLGLSFLGALVALVGVRLVVESVRLRLAGRPRKDHSD